MKGENEIHLNQQTMVEMVEHFFRTRLFQPGQVPEVVSVRQTTMGTGGGNDFIVQTKSANPGAIKDMPSVVKDRPSVGGTER